MTPYDKFNTDLSAVKEYEKIFLFIKNKILSVDSTDILRMQLVFAVSFMDKYFHDLGILYFEKCLTENKTPKKELFSLQMKDILSCITANNGKEILLAFFKKRIMDFTFQMSSDISKISNFMGIDNVFNQLYGKNSDENKRHLDLIVERRNQIVHEADFDNVRLSKRCITQEDVSDSILFIEQFVCSYNSLVHF